MKKLIGSSLVILVMALTASATVVLNEPFAYSDGVLTNVSSGAWTNHSGANSGAVTVSGGKITLDGTKAEDVMRSLGGGYSSQNLYVSFKVNFSALPGATTTYFAHLAQNSSTFRARIWSTVTGAETGKFRLGITSSTSTAGAWVPITTDLLLNTEYKIVMRFMGGTNATLWINPTSEDSIVSRADATDTTTLGSWNALYFAFRQANYLGTTTIDDLLVGTQFSDVQTVGGPPSISGLVAVSIPANTNTGPLAFVVSDVETPVANLTVTATSSNPTLVPNTPANLTFGGPYGNSTLTVTPAAGEQGTANIEVVVKDGNNETAKNTFTITVGSPSISAIANQNAPVGTAKSVDFWVNDAETAGTLIVSATSSDQSVLADANIGILENGSTNRTLLLTNTAAGFAVVTVTVADGTFSIPTSFTLTSYPDNGILLSDDFSYADGSLITNSAPLWTTHSAATGGTGQTQVASSKLLLVNSNSEDFNRWFTNAPVINTGGALIHTRFTVNLSELPTANATGEYFFHIYGFSGAFRGRLFATTNGAAIGKFRFSVSNGSYVTSVFPKDFSIGQTQVLISRYNTATGESTLWVDPVSENSTSVSATDVTTTMSAYGVAFRQATGMGSMSIDDLIVGSTFDQVMLSLAPIAENLAINKISEGVVLSWGQSAFKLAASGDISGPYLPIVGATSPYTNAISGDNKYFRLVWP